MASEPAGSPRDPGSDRFPLDAVQERLLDDMRRDGIALVPFQELFQDESLWEKLRGDIGEFVRTTEASLDELRQRKEGKTYIVRRFLGTSADAKRGKAKFKPNDRWLRLGVSRRILDVVNSYRRQLTHLIDFDNWYTIPDPEAQTRVESQRWHRDAWDNHIVKVFVYFTEVGDEAGPFEYVRGSATGGDSARLYPWQPGGTYPPDDFDGLIDEHDRMTLTGGAGTVIFCDTSGFHRGGWAKTKPRVLSYHTYVGATATKNPRFKVGVRDGTELAPEVEFALSRSLRRKS